MPRAIESRNRWRRLLSGAIVISCLLLSPAQRAAGGSPSITDVKAAFIFNFIKFTTWDEAHFSGDDSPLEICVAGNNALYVSLVRAVDGKTVRGRSLSVSTVESPEKIQAPTCHVVVVGGEEKEKAWRAAALLAGTPVLTVGESPDFVRHGGVIGFTVDGRKLGFEISLTNAKTADLEISSKLLQLARVVE